MGWNFDTARAGDGQISASAFNTHAEAAKIVLRNGRDQRAATNPTPLPPGVVRVHNATGAEVGAFQVLALDGLAGGVDPDTGIPRAAQLVFHGVAPQVPTHWGLFGVVRNAIPIDGVGTAVVSGVTFVEVQIVDDSHEFADVLHDEVSKLGSTGFGAAHLLWTSDAGIGQRYAMVRLGNPSGRILKGKTLACFPKGTSGTIQLYHGAKGSESPVTGKTVQAYNTFGDVAGNAWVNVAWVDTGFELIDAECGACDSSSSSFPSSSSSTPPSSDPDSSEPESSAFSSETPSSFPESSDPSSSDFESSDSSSSDLENSTSDGSSLNSSQQESSIPASSSDTPSSTPSSSEGESPALSSSEAESSQAASSSPESSDFESSAPSSSDPPSSAPSSSSPPSSDPASSAPISSDPQSSFPSSSAPASSEPSSQTPSSDSSDFYSSSSEG